MTAKLSNAERNVRALRLASVIPLAVGAMLLFVALNELYSFFLTFRWPAVAASVVKSEAIVTGADNHDGYCVHYRYSVNGRDHTGVGCQEPFNEVHGRRVRFDPQRFPVGSAVTVYYDPSRPEVSIFLKDEPFWGSMVRVAGAMALMAFGVVMLVFAQRNKRRESDRVTTPTTTDPPFRLTVDDAFTIHRRGTVLTGRIAEGRLNVGDEVHLTGQGSPRKTVVVDIEAHGRLVKTAYTGDKVGVMLRVNKEDVHRGDVLSGS